MPTGDAEWPQEIQHAIQIEHLIANSVASGAVCDDKLDDKVIDISSDNSPTVGTKWKWIAKHVKTEPPSEHKAHTNKANLQCTLSHVAQAFDPKTQTAHSDSRQAKLLESMHMQHPIAQLHDHEAKIQGLCEQIFNLQ